MGPRPGCEPGPGLAATPRERSQAALSATHVSSEILPVAAIPRALSGRKIELPGKKLPRGQPLEEVVNRDIMANPESRERLVEFTRRRAR